MLIINADDFGKTRMCTDRILECFERGRVTSASSMVFMADSERAARLAVEKNMAAGLHLNFTLCFDGDNANARLCESQKKTARFLTSSKYSVLIYNPFLRKEFEYLCREQYDELLHLYGSAPTHIDGHQHFHLAMNVMANKIIPVGSIIRRNFTFGAREKDPLNRLYRSIADRWIMRRYRTTDFFFDISPIVPERIKRIVSYARNADVELMVHPERANEYSYVMSDEFGEAISRVSRGTFRHTLKKNPACYLQF